MKKIFFLTLILLFLLISTRSILAACDGAGPSCGDCSCCEAWKTGSCASHCDPTHAVCEGYCAEYDPATGDCVNWDTHWVCGCDSGGGPPPGGEGTPTPIASSCNFAWHITQTLPGDGTANLTVEYIYDTLPSYCWLAVYHEGTRLSCDPARDATSADKNIYPAGRYAITCHLNTARAGSHEFTLEVGDTHYNQPFPDGCSGVRDYICGVATYNVSLPTPTPTATPTPTPTATPLVADAWFQSAGGDVHGNGNTGTTIPNTCPDPYFSLDPAGIVSTGRTSFSYNISPDKISSFGWQVADPTENLTGFGADGTTQYNYAYFDQKFGSSTSLLPNCNTKPGSGIYAFNGTCTISHNWNLSNRDKIIILVDGNLVVNNEIKVPEGENGGFLAFVVSGNIIFGDTLGTPNVNANFHADKAIEGIYIADGIIETQNDSSTIENNKIFTAGGMFIAHEDFNLQRDLGSRNESYPGDYFEYRPDFLINFPPELGTRVMTWQEVAP